MIFSSLLSLSQKKYSNSKGTMTDIEGNVYQTVKIGNQVWMAENLRVTKFNNGRDIPYVNSNDIWRAGFEPKMCWYNNDTIYKNVYGGLYNWYVVNTNELCPVDWHVPSSEEWETLIQFIIEHQGVGSNNYDHVTEIAFFLKSVSDWEGIGNGIDSYSFSGVPSGLRDYAGHFKGIHTQCAWWSSTQDNYSSIVASRIYLSYDNNFIYKNFAHNDLGFSVRCIQD